MSSRSKTPSFVATFELSQLQGGGSFKDIDTMSEFYRKIYNAGLGICLKSLKSMKASEEWATARKMPKIKESDRKARGKAFSDLVKKYGLEEYSIQKSVKNLVDGDEAFCLWTNSAVVQKVAKRIFQAMEKLQYGQAKRVRFKRKGDFFSFEGKSNKTGVRLTEEEGTFICLIGNKSYRLSYDMDNPYHVHALSSRVKYGRILRKTIKGKERYFVQGIFEGLPYEDKAKKERHRKIVKDREGHDYYKRRKSLPNDIRFSVATDFGPGSIAVATPLTSFERPISLGVDKKQKKVKTLQRSMDKKRRLSNPDNYQDNGTIKKGKKTWNNSKKYLKERRKKADTERRKAAERKSSHGFLSNQILAYGKNHKTEKISYKGWQKGWFGKSIRHHAPSALEGELSRKAEYARGRSERINTYQTALSQHCLCGERRKKALSERTHACPKCGLTAKRDTLAAFLAIFCSKEITKNGEEKWTLDLRSARFFARGHRTLSVSGKSHPRETIKAKPSLASSSVMDEKTAEMVAEKTLDFALEPSSKRDGSGRKSTV